MAAEMDPSQWVVLDHMPLSNANKPMIIDTMNDRFKATLNVYAKHYCNTEDVTSAKLVELDDAKFVLQHWNAEAQLQERTINYQNSTGAPVRARKVGDVRRIMSEMAKVAADAVGGEVDLPPKPALSTLSSDKVQGAYLLNDLIDMNSLEALNQDDAHPVTDAIRNSLSSVDADAAETYLQSDPEVDHQLLIKVGFRLPVGLKAITLRASAEDETAPQLIKLFRDQVSMGFGEAEDQEAQQTLEVSASNFVAGEPLPIRLVKFQNVSTLQLFAESNFGAEVTRIHRLEFWGSVAESVDMKAWKPVKGDVSDPVGHIVEPSREDSGPST